MKGCRPYRPIPVGPDGKRDHGAGQEEVNKEHLQFNVAIPNPESGKRNTSGDQREYEEHSHEALVSAAP